MRLYTIPPDVSFVDALAAGVLARYGADPVTLAGLTILLPNRRACRSLRDAFLRKSDGKPLLLPAIRPIGDVDEDALLLGINAPETDIPPPVDPLRRTLVLAQYLLHGRPEPFTPAQALAMAAALGRFVDSVHTENLDWSKLDTLVPDVYAAHWQISLNFLKDVLRAHWPAHLKSENRIDPAEHRRRMIEAYTASLLANPPAGPVIAAGSTGSIPVTAEMLKVVASLPQGCVVLPGLDTHLDDAEWQAIEEGHPQAGLSKLLLHLDATRAQVVLWDGCDAPAPRAALVSTLMRPATTLAAWKAETLPQGAFDGLAVLEAEALDEEAMAIALIMREHADDPARTDPCVLVTPDRTLASRVSLVLSRWGITIDDSAGLPLAQTPIGRWLQLMCDVIAGDLEPVPLLALLKSGFAAGGKNWPEAAPPFRSFVRALDKGVLRGNRPQAGFAGLSLRTKDEGLAAGVAALEAMFSPVKDANDTVSRIRALVRVAESLAETHEATGADRLWCGDAGEAMANALTRLLEQADVMPELDWRECGDLLRSAMEGVSVRPRYGTHPRLAILGPIEARLYQAGTMILGSLNEGTWPKLAEVDGWMSRPMREKFGLPAPERAITLTAHDFAQGMGAKRVFITRSKNRDNAPTIKSRWLQRLDAVCEAQPKKPDLGAGARYWLDLARRLDAPTQTPLPALRPAPCPPEWARPEKLSATEISKLRRDPYGIYAKHVLGLRPLDPLDAEPDAGDEGTLVHAALCDFAKTYPRDLPPDAAEKLIAIGRKRFDAAHPHPDVMGHWWPRFERMTGAFIAHEKKWREKTLQVYPEISGSYVFETAQGPFTLEARADRLEKRQDGWAVIDYKTGAVPDAKDVRAGLEPQLPLMGMMLRAGSFNEKLGTVHTPADISALAYWKTSGGRDTLETRTHDNVDDLCDKARKGLEELVRLYRRGDTPFVCWPDPDNELPESYEYAHLARIAEWTQGQDGEDAA